MIRSPKMVIDSLITSRPIEAVIRSLLRLNMIDRVQIKSVNRITSVSMIGHSLNTIIAIQALHNFVEWENLFLWSLYSFGIAFAVFYCNHKKAMRPISGATGFVPVGYKAILLAVLLALPWAILITLCLGAKNSHIDLIVVALALGMAASGSIVLSPIRPAAIAYMATILVSTLITIFIVLKGQGYAILGALAFSYLLFLVSLINIVWERFSERVSSMRQLETAIVETTEARAQIESVAMTDSLTDLPNRRSFVTCLSNSYDSGQNVSRSNYALLYLDLDHFKMVNDSLGHPVGDELLKVVAKRISANIRPDDIAARLGGDEFAILAKNIYQNDQAATVARRLISELSKPYQIMNHDITIGVSIGIVIGKINVDKDELMKLSDVAMYEAKAAGRNTYRIFQEEMQERVNQKRTIEIGLHKALQENEFELHFQPIYSLAPLKLAGMEALIRWRHPDKGLIAPDEFLPVADEVGVMDRIGRWVMLEACRQAVCWPRSLFVAVNISPTEIISGNLGSNITKALKISGLPASRLEIEITETALLNNVRSVQRQLHDIKKIGAHISMDDFGTGYSSLSYLANFPFDKIKIDRSFIHDLEHSPKSLAIVRTIIQLARNFECAVVAEGLETSEQLVSLKDLGVNQGQGYYLSKPLPTEKVIDFLAVNYRVMKRSEKYV